MGEVEKLPPENPGNQIEGNLDGVSDDTAKEIEATAEEVKGDHGFLKVAEAFEP